MTLAPQKANAQNKQTAGKSKKKEEKRQRRIAPEFTLRWSEEATGAVQGRSADYVRDVTAAANARIYTSEALLCGVDDGIVSIGPIDPVLVFDSWWTPFRVEDLWFVLKYEDALIREYVLCSGKGPAPDAAEIEPPVVTRRQKGPPPKQIGPKPRPKKGDAKAARPAFGKKPPRQTKAERLFLELWDLVQTGQDTSQAHLTHSLEQLRRLVKPRLLRSLIRIRRISGICLHAMADALAPFVQRLRQCAASARRISTSFTGLREFAFATPGPGARLEPRWIGQNSGLRLLLYSWIGDELPPPVDWSEHLFGVDWSLNLFGALPEEKQVYT